MIEDVPIYYSGFWDRPLSFLVRYQGMYWYFSRSFDDTADEYETHYQVATLEHIPDESSPEFWAALRTCPARNLGTVAVNEVQFDRSHRQTIRTDVLDRLLSQHPYRKIKRHRNQGWSIDK